MVKVGKKIVKFRVPILILSIILLIPAVWGYVNTRKTLRQCRDKRS